MTSQTTRHGPRSASQGRTRWATTPKSTSKTRSRSRTPPFGAAGHEVTDEDTRELGARSPRARSRGTRPQRASSRSCAPSRPTDPPDPAARPRLALGLAARSSCSDWMDTMGTNDITGAGASAKREYDRRRARDDAKIRETWGDGRIGAIAVALSGERQSTAAWKSGAAGEAEVGRALEAIESEHIVVLHDRASPFPARTSTTSSSPAPAFWVIDAKHYRNKRAPPAGRGRAVPAPRTERLVVGGTVRSSWTACSARWRSSRTSSDRSPCTARSASSTPTGRSSVARSRLRGIDVCWPKRLSKQLAALEGNGRRARGRCCVAAHFPPA